jgi:DNA (cytosine-5)-methyltransferase 1
MLQSQGGAGVGSEPPTVVDLFCGAGGMSLGFTQAGFRVVLAMDHSLPAVETYRANLHDHVVCGEITESTGLPPATVIVGGPPCQGFSSAGLRRAGDHRNTLVGCFAQLVARHRPKAFVFENVEGFLTAESGARVLDLLGPVIDAGYRVQVRKVNAANYGVPQHRKRVLAVGGLGWDPSFPEPTHRAHGAPGAHRIAGRLPPTPSLAEALAGLPAPTSGETDDRLDHWHTPLTGTDLERARALKPGQTMRDLPHELWHASYGRRAFRRVMDGTPTDRRGGAPAGVRRLRGDEPSKAMTGGARSEFLHPDEDRNLTLRECARLQTFPDGFAFRGSVGDRVQLIGNAVPPRLAWAVAATLMRDLERAEHRTGSGALLSFVPTLSTGMSPVLDGVARMVLRRYSSAVPSSQLTLWR